MKPGKIILAISAALFIIAVPFTSFAEVISSISLEVSSNIQAGSSGSDVEVKSLSDSCTVVRTDIRNEPEGAWSAGDTPKLYVLIERNDGYSFPTTNAKLDSDALTINVNGASVTSTGLVGFDMIHVNLKLEALGGNASEPSGEASEIIDTQASASEEISTQASASNGAAVSSSSSDSEEAEVSETASSQDPVTYTVIKGSAGANTQEYPAKLFDNNAGTKWCTNTSSGYVIFMASRPVAATGYHFVTGNDNSTYKGRNPKSWTLYGCNAAEEPDKDSSLWQVIDSVESDTTMENVNYTEYYFPLSAAAPSYQYYMLKATSSVSPLQLSELALSYEGSSFTFKKGSSSSSSSSSSSGGGTVSGLLCATCHGSGRRTNGQTCFACGGTGYVP